LKTCFKSFKSTDIWPKDSDVILKQFNNKEQVEEAEASRVTGSDWCHIECLVQAAVTNCTADELRKLSSTLYSLAIQNKLLQEENSSLQEALDDRKKCKNCGQGLDLQREDLYYGGATFWLLRKIRQTQAREVGKQQQEEAEAALKLLQEQQKEEHRVEQERLKKEHKHERAGKLPARAARIAAQNTTKAIQNAPPTKQKALQAAPPKFKRLQRWSDSAACAASPEAAPAAPPKVSSCGRAITLLRKLR
jgi:hypothetical protein